MKDTSAPSRPGLLRRLLWNRKSLTVTVFAVAVTTAIVAQAAASGGVSSVCLSQEAASNQKGGWNSPAVGPNTQSKQITKGATRPTTIWSGPIQKCPVKSAANCPTSYWKGESVAYRKAISMEGGFTATGAFDKKFPIPFPVLTVAGPIKDETKTTSWNTVLTVTLKPGERARPVVMVDYQEWSGNFVGGYMHDADTNTCHAFHLDPNQEFGQWHGEVAQADYSTWEFLQ